jgi:hypothetical protein
MRSQTIRVVTFSGLFSWGTLYPIGDFADPVRTVWLGVTLCGAVAYAVALRPGCAPENDVRIEPRSVRT